MMARMTISRLAAAFALAGLLLTAHAAAPPKSAASATQITDIAHWQHPARAVFEKYKVPLLSVTMQGTHATFQAAFPFDPLVQPNDATMRALSIALLEANGWWGYTLVSLQDGVAIDVSWNKKTRTLQTTSRRL